MNDLFFWAIHPCWSRLKLCSMSHGFCSWMKCKLFAQQYLLCLVEFFRAKRYPLLEGPIYSLLFFTKLNNSNNPRCIWNGAQILLGHQEQMNNYASARGLEVLNYQIGHQNHLGWKTVDYGSLKINRHLAILLNKGTFHTCLLND